jgi:asparagine synthase (glutamine-hydrolysing)
MSPVEVALGYLYGVTGKPSVAPDHRDARTVLENGIRQSLIGGPCGVTFSGGRDSSLVLAVAAHVARREGLAEPVPLTYVFPGAPRSEETEWQELVVRHIGLRHWERIVLHDELDLIGDIAASRLTAHGVLWPPSAHVDVPALRRMSGGTLLDGEGGDEVLGPALHRITPVARLLRSPRPIRWPRVRRALRATSPTWVRARHEAWRRRDEVAWLTPAALVAWREAIREEEASRPLRFSSSVHTVPVRRSQAIGDRNRSLIAAEHGVGMLSPLLAPEFVQAVAADGKWLGRGDRTTVMRWLASDLLPDAVLSRASKASFGETYWTPRAREFAAAWNGQGVDEQLVDVAALQTLWQTGTFPLQTASLLQQVWLASTNGDRLTAT